MTLLDGVVYRNRHSDSQLQRQTARQSQRKADGQNGDRKSHSYTYSQFTKTDNQTVIYRDKYTTLEQKSSGFMV